MKNHEKRIFLCLRIHIYINVCESKNEEEEVMFYVYIIHAVYAVVKFEMKNYFVNTQSNEITSITSSTTRKAYFIY